MLKSHVEELECMKECDPDVLIAELINNQRKISSNDEIYYDEKQDKSWVEHYYCNITGNLNPSHLFDEYHDLISKTHQYTHPYYISKDQYLYTWVDLQTNGKLKCIYSGNQKNPQTLIEEDFKTIQMRFERYQELINIQRFSNQRIEDHIQRISNQYKFNTEHVVPQSWFEASEPMKGDLHHLFACEPRCNSMRANYPYYEFESDILRPFNMRNSCGNHEENRFEPAYRKGIVARAQLYFLLRYPNKIKRKFRKSIDITLLTDWHNKYKVTEYEKHRNKAIFEIQGNRNPFIDLPDLINKIAFPSFLY